MGLFLGASFLSILEIVDFIIHRAMTRHALKKIENKDKK